MRHARWITVPLTLTVTAAAYLVYSQASRPREAEMPESVAFRVLFGLTDKEPAPWDGKVSVTGGRLLKIEGWRFTASDAVSGLSGWRLSTRRAPAAAGAAPGTLGAMLENGVLLTLLHDNPDSRVEITTAKGSFDFRPRDVTWDAPAMFLRNQIRVDRIASTLRLTDSPEDQDFPTIAQSGDDVWVSYVEFVRGDRGQHVEGNFATEPAGFDFLARPAGGDQVLLLHYSKSRRLWTGPIAVSRQGRDILRTAVAVDRTGRVWVIWAENIGGNFDLYARFGQNGNWSSDIRLTFDPGPDLNPVAAADTSGRVWIAWQGYRNGNLEILASVLDGNSFTPEATISSSPANDWDPAIAAASNGEVAVAWDTYDKSSYDVLFRRLRFSRGIQPQAQVTAAASDAFEARPSISYDPQDRLWIAWEHSGSSWGKDFGAYESTGVALYQGHTPRVRCFQGNDSFETVAPLVNVLPAVPSSGTFGQGRVGPPANVPQPNPAAAENRKPNGGPGSPQLPRNSFPRIFTDQAGAVYLAFRSHSGVRGTVGSNWYEQIVWFDGAKWQGPWFVPYSDNLLDNRPAAAALGPGHLLMVLSTDHRQSPGLINRRQNEFDPIHNDLYAAEYRLPVRSQKPELKLVVEQPAAPLALVESAQIALMRDYRVTIAGEELRLMRGEFHRHTEISFDGGNDGPLIDAYRYLIDAAGMDWGGCCDHDNGGGREYFWWLEQKMTDAYNLPGRYTAMFSYERSVRYPEGHRNVLFADRGIRPLPRLPATAPGSPPDPAPDTQMLYRYLRRFGGIGAMHTSGTDMGTDWRDNDPVNEPVVEIYQGDRQNYELPDAPRSNSAVDSIGGWRPLGFVNLALDKGYRLGFQASSDHISTHMSYANIWVARPDRYGVLDAFLKRRVYGATDNILADVRCAGHFMGEEFTLREPPSIEVRLAGTANFARVFVIKDGQYVYTHEPNSPHVEFIWRDAGAVRGRTSYYYIRGEQVDGELVWASPMWITLP